MRQTLPLDPLGVTRYLNLARILIAGGRYDEAEAALHKAIELQPAGRSTACLSYNPRRFSWGRAARCKMHSWNRKDLAGLRGGSGAAGAE